MTSLSSILSLLLLMLLPSTTTIVATSEVAATFNLINQTCRNSSQSDPNIDFKYCVKAFNTSRSSRYANLTRLGLISINILKHNVKNTTSWIRVVLEDKRENKKNAMRAGLKDCLELYSDSISTVGEAARDYRAKRMDDANVKISSVMDDSETCEDGFRDVGVGSPLTKENNSTFQLSAIALSIINMMPPPSSHILS